MECCSLSTKKRWIKQNMCENLTSEKMWYKNCKRQLFDITFLQYEFNEYSNNTNDDNSNGNYNDHDDNNDNKKMIIIKIRMLIMVKYISGIVINSLVSLPVSNNMSTASW